MARRFLMLLEGECLEENIAAVAERYDLSRQRYYQLRQDYQDGGLAALAPEKTGPKTN
jgi:transposase-like protein